MPVQTRLMAQRVDGRFGFAVGVDLQIDVGDVALDGAMADEECVGDGAVAGAGRDQSQYLDFPLSQSVGLGMDHIDLRVEFGDAVQHWTRFERGADYPDPFQEMSRSGEVTGCNMEFGLRQFSQCQLPRRVARASQRVGVVQASRRLHVAALLYVQLSQQSLRSDDP